MPINSVKTTEIYRKTLLLGVFDHAEFKFHISFELNTVCEGVSIILRL